jgi:putative nucleotidyltransferase with HDIG domain
MAQVLIVDDERSIRTTLGEFVKEDGHEVFVAESADEALRIGAEHDLDVVVTDIILPRTDGIALLKRVHQVRPDIQVIVITGEPTVDTASEAVRQGAFDYLSKPITGAAIRAAVARAARIKKITDDRRRLEEENARYREHLEEEVERVAGELQASEAEYRALFEDSPVSLWVDDFSGVREVLDDLRGRGVVDLEGYLDQHPDFVHACADRVRIVDVNEATVRLHRARRKEDFLAGENPRPEGFTTTFGKRLVAIWNGERVFETTALDVTLDGEPMHVSLRWTVPPGQEDSLERVLLAKTDITGIVEAERKVRKALDGTIEAIGRATESRDPYTAGHQRQVTQLAVAIVKELGLDGEVLEATQAAGLMHDIGKLSIPAEILSKPSALTPMEMELMKCHPRAGYDILKTVDFPWPIAEIVLQHHERLDGSGYPRGLTAEELRIEARILAVADVVEAMASHRPYRPSLGVDAAMSEILKGRGSRFDADVVDACVRLFREKGFAFSS